MLHVLEEKSYWQEGRYTGNPWEYHVSSAVSVETAGADCTNRSHKQHRDRENVICLQKQAFKEKMGLMKIKDLGIVNCSET